MNVTQSILTIWALVAVAAILFIRGATRNKRDERLRRQRMEA